MLSLLQVELWLESEYALLCYRLLYYRGCLCCAFDLVVHAGRIAAAEIVEFG